MRNLTAPALAFALLLGCHAPHSGSVPMDSSGQHTTTWDYVRARYDRNGDGSIQPAEHNRGSFERLDRNRDGLLGPEDFAPISPQAAVRAMLAEQLVAWYFQTDDEPRRLGRAELERAFATYDASSDGQVDAEEFGCAAEARAALGAPPPEGPVGSQAREVDAFELLLAVADVDRNGLLEGGELNRFFVQRDDGDGVWELEGSPATARDRADPTTSGGRGPGGPLRTSA